MSVMEIYEVICLNAERFNQCHSYVTPYDEWVANIYRTRYNTMNPNTQMAYALWLGIE